MRWLKNGGRSRFLRSPWVFVDSCLRACLHDCVEATQTKGCLGAEQRWHYNSGDTNMSITDVFWWRTADWTAMSGGFEWMFAAEMHYLTAAVIAILEKQAAAAGCHLIEEKSKGKRAEESVMNGTAINRKPVVYPVVRLIDKKNFNFRFQWVAFY